MTDWIVACTTDELEDEGALPHDHLGQEYVICLDDEGAVHCLGGLCPHDGAHLAGGLVEGRAILCPDCDAPYDLESGIGPDGARLPVLPVRVMGDRVEIDPGR